MYTCNDAAKIAAQSEGITLSYLASNYYNWPNDGRPSGCFVELNSDGRGVARLNTAEVAGAVTVTSNNRLVCVRQEALDTERGSTNSVPSRYGEQSAIAEGARWGRWGEGSRLEALGSASEAFGASTRF